LEEEMRWALGKNVEVVSTINVGAVFELAVEAPPPHGLT
jgi:hypothetical protein